MTKVLRWFVIQGAFRSQAPVAAEVVARSRYAEDLLQEAIARGMQQYVLVGAGFDSFALRHRDSHLGIRIFELDHPDTQRVKIERIHALGIKLPEIVEFVEIDFEEEAVADLLDRSSYEVARPAFFSWLGTVPYLTNAATTATLRSIASYAEPGSEIVFDYLVPDAVLSSSDRRVVQRLRRFTARRAEPLIGEIHPNKLKAMLESIGMELIQNLSGADQEQLYFANRQDGLRPLPSACFTHARVSKRVT